MAKLHTGKPVLKTPLSEYEHEIESSEDGSAVSARPSHEEIAALAYEYWQAHGESGSADEHWFRAEREVAQRNEGSNEPLRRFAAPKQV